MFGPCFWAPERHGFLIVRLDLEGAIEVRRGKFVVMLAQIRFPTLHIGRFQIVGGKLLAADGLGEKLYRFRILPCCERVSACVGVGVGNGIRARDGGRKRERSGEQQNRPPHWSDGASAASLIRVLVESAIDHLGYLAAIEVDEKNIGGRISPTQRRAAAGRGRRPRSCRCSSRASRKFAGTRIPPHSAHNGSRAASGTDRHGKRRTSGRDRHNRARLRTRCGAPPAPARIPPDAPNAEYLRQQWPPRLHRSAASRHCRPKAWSPLRTPYVAWVSAGGQASADTKTSVARGVE